MELFRIVESRGFYMSSLLLHLINQVPSENYGVYKGDLFLDNTISFSTGAKNAVWHRISGRGLQIQCYAY